MAKDKIRSMSDFYLYKYKDAGVASGAVYKLKPELVKEGEDPNTLYFIKTTYNEQLMSELVGAGIARVFLGDSAPEILLLKGELSQVVSKQIKGFTSMTDFTRLTGIPYGCWPHGCIINDKGKAIPIQSYLLDWQKQHSPQVHIFEDAVKAQAVVELVEHFDLSPSNFGVVVDNGKSKAALIDFNLSLVGGVNWFFIDDSLTHQPSMVDRIKINQEFVAKKDVVYAVIKDGAATLKAAGFNSEKVDSYSKKITAKMEDKFLRLEHDILLQQFTLAEMGGHRLERFTKALKHNDFAAIITANEYAQRDFGVSIFRLYSQNKQIAGVNLLKIMTVLADKAPQSMDQVLKEAMLTGKEEVFTKLLPYMKNEPAHIAEAFSQAISSGKDSHFERLLPFIEKKLADLQKFFALAVSSKNEHAFAQLYTYMKVETRYMSEALVEAVKVSDETMFKRILESMKHDSLELRAALVEVVRRGNEKFFDIMTPYRISWSEAFAEGVRKGDERFFNKMLENMQHQPNNMREALGEAVRSGNATFFKQMFKFMIDNPESMSEAFAASVYVGKEEFFEQLFFYMLKVPDFIPFIDIVEAGNEKALERLLPLISPRNYSVSGAIGQAIIGKKERMLEKILEQVREIPYVSKHIVELINIAKHNNNIFTSLINKGGGKNSPIVNELCKLLPRMLEDNPSFIEVLPRIEPQHMEIAFTDAVRTGKEKLFMRMLPLMAKVPRSMQEALVETVRKDDANMFEQMLPRMANDPRSMEMALAEALSRGNTKMFEQMLPHMLSEPWSMDEAFHEVVRSGKEELFNKMLPLMEKAPQTMQAALAEALRRQNTKMFERILPSMLAEKWSMKDAFNEVVRSGNGKNFAYLLSLIKNEEKAMRVAIEESVLSDNNKVLEQLLQNMQTGPAVMEEALHEAAKSGKLAMLEIMLPRLEKNSALIKNAFNEAVKSGKQAIFELMLPYLRKEPTVMANALYEAVRGDKLEMFKKMLPYMIDDPMSLKYAFEEAARSKKQDMFEKMLPGIGANPALLKFTFQQALYDNRQAMFESMLPYMAKDPANLDDAFHIVIGNRRYTMLERMIEVLPELPDLSTNIINLMGIANNNAKIFISLVEKGAKNNPELVQMLNRNLPYLLENHEFREQYEAARKAKVKEEQPSLLSKLDFLPNFPVAEASSKMRPIPILTTEELERLSAGSNNPPIQPPFAKPAALPQAGKFVQKIAPAQPQSSQASSVSPSYPGSPGMAALAAGMIGKAIYESAKSWGDYLFAPKAKQEEITKAKANFEKKSHKIMQKIEGMEVLVAELRQRQTEIDEHFSLDKTQRRVLDKCIDLRASLNDMEMFFYQGSEKDLVLSKNTLAMVKAGLKQMQEELAKLKPDIEMLKKQNEKNLWLEKVRGERVSDRETTMSWEDYLASQSTQDNGQKR